MMNPLPSQEELLRRFDYSIITGELYYKISPSSRVKVGDCVCNDSNKGYLRTKINGVNHQVANIIWKMMTGDDPPLEVDHHNRIRSDNSWINLRLSTRLEQQLNRDCVKTPYILYNKTNKNYRICRKIDGKSTHFGTYNTLQEAQSRVNELGWYYYEM